MIEYKNIVYTCKYMRARVCWDNVLAKVAHPPKPRGGGTLL